MIKEIHFGTIKAVDMGSLSAGIVLFGCYSLEWAFLELF
jgi:hypothetical protein